MRWLTGCLLTLCGVVSLWIMTAALPAAPADTRQPPSFSPQQLSAAEQVLHEVFQEDYDRAKTSSAARQQLAQTLLQQSKEIHDEPDVRYVALAEARDLAALAGDTETAFAAIDELAKHYVIDVAAMQTATLERAASSVTEASAAQALAELALRLANEASDQDRQAQAVRLGKVAATAAQSTENAALIKSIAVRNQELQTAYKETLRLQPFEARLAADPQDAQAHLEIGTSWCFVRDRWEKGLPHLLQSNEAALRELAKAELAAPQTGPAQAALAESWYQAAQQYPPALRLPMLRRSFQWYRQALSRLDGPGRQQIEQRLTKLADVLPLRLRVTDVAVEVRRLSGHNSEVLSAAFVPGGRQAISAGADRTVRLWDLATGKQLRLLEGHVGPVLCVAVSPDGRRAYSGGQDHTLRFWDLTTGKQLRSIVAGTEYVNDVAVSADGKLVAAAGEDRLIRLYDTASGQLVQKLQGHGGAVFRVAFAPTAKLLASGSVDQTIRLWDAANGQEVRQLRGHSGDVLGLSWSPDGRQLLSSGGDSSIRLWEAATGKELLCCTAHTAAVGSVAFAPDGLRFLSGSDDRTLRLWNAETGQELRRLSGHSDAIYRVAISPDGRWALSCGLDGTVRLWGERH